MSERAEFFEQTAKELREAERGWELVDELSVLSRDRAKRLAALARESCEVLEEILGAPASARTDLLRTALDDMKRVLARYEQEVGGCVCGEPDTPGVHRHDGPCYEQEVGK